MKQKNIEAKKKIKNKVYYSYNTRVFLHVFLILIFFVITILCVNNSFSVPKEKIINYTAKSNVDYKVALKDNDFYDTKTLPKDMLYVASLIESVPVTFNYTFESSENVDLDFEYSITGKLRITNPDKSKNYYEKNYTLLDSKTISLNGEQFTSINETVNIDYDSYNKIANSFKSNYGIDSNSEFTIYLVVNKKTDEENSLVLNSNDVMSMEIPLSEKSINISLNYKNINEESTILKNSTLLVKNYIYIISGIISLLLTLVFTVRLLRLLNISKGRLSKHDRLIKKIIREYDRYVVETTNIPDYSDKELIKIPSFDELLDVRDNLKLPIMHYLVTKGEKSIFYINHSNTLYTYTVKDSDLKK